MKKSVPYHDIKIESLKDKEYARIYLEAALEAYKEDGDREAFLFALRDIAEAQGGAAEIAKHIDKPKQSVYKSLSDKGNPRLDTLDAILGSLGFRLSIEPIGTEIPSTR